MACAGRGRYIVAVDLEPSVEPLSFLTASAVFRGLSDAQLAVLRTTGFMSPRRILGSGQQIIERFRSMPVQHVMELKREHFVSFSLSDGHAVAYATSCGKKDGYVASVTLAPVEGAMIDGGSEPSTYVRTDGTHWIDPRHLTIGAPDAAWGWMRARALADQEVLLTAGALYTHQMLIRRVRRAEHDPQCAAWATWGERGVPWPAFGRNNPTGG